MSVYIGNGKRSEKAPFFSVKGTINLTRMVPGITAEQVDAEYKDALFVGGTGNLYMRVEVNENRQVDQYGNTHSIKADTYKKPDQVGQDTGNPAGSAAQAAGWPASSVGQNTPQGRADVVSSVFSGVVDGEIPF